MAAIGMAAVLAAPAAAQSSGGWSCTSEKTTGFSNSSGTWASVDFAVQARYTIRPLPGSTARWIVRPADRSDVVEANCPEDFSRLQVLHCRGTVTEFKFNRATGRFLKAYLAGYWSYTPGAPFFNQDGSDTPTIEIGTCSKL